MQANTDLPPITVSSRDLARLEQLLDSPVLRQVPAALALGEELGRATVLSPERMLLIPDAGQLDSRFVPGLDEVVDALVLGTSVALLSTMKVGLLGGNPGLIQAARFRLDLLVRPVRGIGT